MSRGHERRSMAVPVKVGVYTVTMLLILAALIVVFGDFRNTKTTGYSALFADASGLAEGQNVRAAGVPVGKVTAVTLRSDASVKVSFTVAQARPLDTRTEVAIEYENLTGDRYLEISPGTTGPAQRLAAGAMIPRTRTSPALDIDSLVGGFKPLFQSIDADDIDDLTSSLIAVLQGQGEITGKLLQHLSSLTSTLADQDSVIGDVVDNFNTVLGTVDANRTEVSAAVVDLEQLVHEFASRPDPVGAVLTRLQQATLSTSGLLSQVRPDLRASVTQLNRLAGNLDADKGELGRVISSLPAAYKRLARMGAYGSVFQLYACGATLRLSDPNGENVDIPLLDQTAGRCAP